jgi:RNA polymerase sigma-70 factor (ECF subfamily)
MDFFEFRWTLARALAVCSRGEMALFACVGQIGGDNTCISSSSRRYVAMNDSSSRTSVTLLEQLRQSPKDPDAWKRFESRYGPKILLWCRGWGLQDADANDVTQEVLLKLAQRMSAFEYDPARSFRGWLHAVVRHAWADWMSQPRRRERCGSEDVWQRLCTEPAADDLEKRIEEEFEQHVVAEAKKQVQARVEVTTWRAYALMAERGLSGAEVAAQLQIPEARVYKYKSRIQQMLQEEVRLVLQAD